MTPTTTPTTRKLTGRQRLGLLVVICVVSIPVAILSRSKSSSAGPAPTVSGVVVSPTASCTPLIAIIRQYSADAQDLATHYTAAITAMAQESAALQTAMLPDAGNAPLIAAVTPVANDMSTLVTQLGQGNGHAFVATAGTMRTDAATFSAYCQGAGS